MSRAIPASALAPLCAELLDEETDALPLGSALFVASDREADRRSTAADDVFVDSALEPEPGPRWWER